MTRGSTTRSPTSTPGGSGISETGRRRGASNASPTANVELDAAVERGARRVGRLPARVVVRAEGPLQRHEAAPRNVRDAAVGQRHVDGGGRLVERLDDGERAHLGVLERLPGQRHVVARLEAAVRLDREVEAAVGVEEAHELLQRRRRGVVDLDRAPAEEDVRREAGHRLGELEVLQARDVRVRRQPAQVGEPPQRVARLEVVVLQEQAKAASDCAGRKEATMFTSSDSYQSGGAGAGGEAAWYSVARSRSCCAGRARG